MGILFCMDSLYHHDSRAKEKKRLTTAVLLQDLKTEQEDSLQRAYIDSVCSLLTYLFHYILSFRYILVFQLSAAKIM